MTYLAFVFSCAYDVYTTMRVFQSGTVSFHSTPCGSSVDTLWEREGSFGCYIIPSSGYGHTFVGHAVNLTNIISVALKVENRESTLVYNESELPRHFLQYDVSLYACYSNVGCSLNADDAKRRWEPVLDLYDQFIPFPDFVAPRSSYADHILIGNMFQNQEALPVNGPIRSYFYIVRYTSESNPFSYAEENVVYTLLTISRPYIKNEAIIRAVLVGLTAVVFVAFMTINFKAVPEYGKWLYERKWISFYFIALMMYQNPMYCVVIWMDDAPVSYVFAAYMLDVFGQACFYVLLLLFADGLRRRMIGSLQFYLPKVILGLIICISNAAIVAVQFPTIDPGNDRSPITAVVNWSNRAKLIFTSFYFVLMVSLIIWTVWGFYCLWSCSAVLRRLPYMNTRYLQLWFRFFFLQASLVALYYVFEYAVVTLFISKISTWHQNADSTADNVSTLFRYQMQLLGKLMFLTTYSVILAFLFLPPTSFGSSSSSMLSTYVITRDEMKAIVKARRATLTSKHAALTNFSRTKAEVLCIDLCLDLLEVSYEAYYDLEGEESVSGYGICNIESLGYKVIDRMYNDEHDMYCLIAKHETLQQIVVSFRYF